MSSKSSLGDQFLTARATPKLVGHLWACKKIRSAINDTRYSYLIYIHGSGGIGKTSVVREILRTTPRNSVTLYASNLIDLYHIQNNSITGLIESFFDVLPGLKSYVESLLRKEYPLHYELKRDHLTTSEIVSLPFLRGVFMDSLNRFRGKKKLVIAIDTAEKLLLARDFIQNQLKLDGHVPGVIQWLVKELIPSLENAVIILAARPEDGNYLLGQLRKVKNKKFLPIQLKSLTDKEVMAYFDAIIEAARKDKKQEAANLLSKVSKDEKYKIWKGLSSYSGLDGTKGVRPILLSLAIDYLATRNRSVVDLLAIINEGEGNAKGLASEIVTSLIESRAGNRSVTDLILAMALAPKGMDGELLFRLYEHGLVEAGDVKKILNLLANLSFVKVRPRDSRIFLHDEVQKMIREKLYESQPQRAETIRESIVAFYAEKVDQALKTARDGQSLNTFAEIAWRLYSLQVEHLHYLLASASSDGMEIYYKYVEQAVMSGNEGLDLQLRAELLADYYERQKNALALSENVAQ